MKTTEVPGFLASGGEIAALIQAVDWRSTPLGPAESWPAVIKGNLATWLDSPQPMFLAWGPDLRFFFNQAYAPFLGARLPGAMGRPFRELWYEIWDDIEPIVKRALDGEGSRFENMPLVMQRNGYDEQTWWTFTYMPLRDENGLVVGMLCTTSDATPLVLASQQASLERARQRLMLQQMPGFVGVLAGPDHVFEYVNDAYREIAGPRDFVGIGVREVFPELQGQGFFELLDEVYRSGAPFVAHDMPIQLSGRSGLRFIDLLYHPIRDDDGAVTGIFVGGYDVTDRVTAERAARRLNETLEDRVEERTQELMRAQDALRQAQKLEAVGQLTGGVAHDFNNFLAVIGSSVEIMRRKNLPAERQQRYMDAISDTVRRASKLTGQLLAFARRQPLSPEVFDVGAQLQGIAELIRPLVGPNIEISIAAAGAHCYAEADINQFDTALMNLAANAKDAMRGEGRLTIALGVADSVPAAHGQAARAGEYVCVSVRDTGAGIEADKLQAIFEPFYTTKEVGKGTGLGLSQVFGFARQSGGDVLVQSALGLGATFTLYLPKAARPATSTSAGAIQAEAPAREQRARILVVEDNPAIGQLATELLHELGYDTELAADATLALRELEVDSQRYDLVFSDVMMPGINGLELARVVREIYPHMPVVLTSGYSSVLADEGLQGFELIQKPYSVETLAAVIGQAINASVAAG